MTTMTKQDKYQGFLSRLVLLLLMMIVGTQGTWAETIVGQVFYEQNYESAGVGADWTTSVSGRYTPTILTESTNHYLGVVNTSRYNNGCLLTNTSLAGKVSGGTDFLMTFDLKVSSSNNQSPTKFEIKDANGTGTIFSLTATGTTTTSWALNGGTNYTLPNTDKVGGDQTIADVPWYSVKIKRVGTMTYVTIMPKSGGDAIVNNVSVTASSTGGLGNMEFTTKRYNANFAIDNIRVTSLFSFSSDEATIDITNVGTGDRTDVSSLLPSVINEVDATGFSYSSSNQSVAKIDENGKVYLIGVGTTSIGISGTNSDTYKSNYELTVYGTSATVNTTSTGENTPGSTKTYSWELGSKGLLAKGASVSLGGATMTYGLPSETAVSIDDAGTYVLKVIDANGYAHPLLDSYDNHVPSSLSFGGTYYKFVTVQAGTLTVTGKMNTPKLYTSEGVETSLTGEGNTRTASLAAGTTYYLYNSEGNVAMLNSVSYSYTLPTIAWSAVSATVDIMDVGDSNPNTIDGLPTLSLGTAKTDNNDDGYVKGYKSSNSNVATFFSGDDAGKVHIRGVGTTTITVIDGNSNTASYELTVNGNTVSHAYDGSNTMTFLEEGVLKKSTDNPGAVSQTLSSGLTVTYGYTGETSIVTTYNGMTVLKVIDGNGYSHPNLTGDGTGVQPPSTIPWEGVNGGTFVKLNATSSGYLIVTGNVNSTYTKLYKWGTTTTTPELLTLDFNEEQHTMSVSLAANAEGDNYYLYNSGDKFVPMVHSISYVPAFFADYYKVTAIPEEGGSVTIANALLGITSPEYSIEAKKGDVSSDSPTITGDTNGCTVTGITKGGVLKIKATEYGGTTAATFYLTIAYPATAYPGKLWNFNDGTSIHTTITTAPPSTTPPVGWTARYKNASNSRDARWFYNNALAGDNAFAVERTAGLVFETSAGGFYMRNDEELWRHIGMFRRGASFTIPQLKADDVVELNWKRDAESSGATFTATNVTDLRGKTVSESFVITGSRSRDTSDLGGMTSFIVAADGDVTFTLEDNGYTDLLSVRIYSGGYKPTMRNINQYDGSSGVTAPVTMLLDGLNTEESRQRVILNYCNPLRGTATGPAMYVLKGYIDGTDNVECVTGSDSQKPGNTHVDVDGYPIPSDEQALLYAQRRQLSGFRMYNDSWESANNTYNNGVIEATGGYGKVTVRLNNYTNDMKYVIGYTPDYTVTFGSAPHQLYPFTWDFTNISGGAVLGRSNNAASSISTDYQTWTGLGYETYQLDTETSNGSLYVPGATLVTAARSLGEKGSVNSLNLNAKGNDEFNGLGFEGKIAFKLAQQGETANDAPNEWTRGAENSLLEYTIDGDEAYMAQKTVTGEVITWTPARLEAGDGYVTFGSPAKLQSTNITTSQYAYHMDGGNTKNVLLEPQRPFQNGDVIHLKGYAPNTVSPQKSGFSFYAGATDASSAALVTVYFAANAVADTEYDLTYTVKRGDGLAGRSQVYLCRADKTTTVHLSEVSITGDDASAPTSYSYERAITCVEATTITIPDLTAGHFVYIESSAAPYSSTNLTAAVAADGLDAKTANIHKYKVTDAGNATVTFAAGVKVYRIGVTGITKPLTRVGSGDAWATESRATNVTQDAAIDYTQTGKFTVNDIKANIVSAKNYATQKVTVKMSELTNAVPAETGLVLKLKLKYAEGDAKSGGGTMTADEAETATDNAVLNFDKAKNDNAVPLFAPPHSATILSLGAVGFGGTQGNLMKANVIEQTFTSETETIDAVEYARFIFANRYMKWQKVGNAYAEPTDNNFVLSGDVPVFYRMHLYDVAVGGDAPNILNTLDANKAYMLIRSTSVPDALWNSSGGSAKRFVAIEGVSDMNEITDYTESTSAPVNDAIYSVSGQWMGNDESVLSPGIYIRSGKKFVVR